MSKPTSQVLVKGASTRGVTRREQLDRGNESLARSVSLIERRIIEASPEELDSQPNQRKRNIVESLRD